MAVMQRRPDDVASRAAVAAQRVGELIEEDRDPVLDLVRCWRGECSRGDLRATATDDLFAVARDEVVKHGATSRFIHRTCVWRNHCAKKHCAPLHLTAEFVGGREDAFEFG